MANIPHRPKLDNRAPEKQRAPYVGKEPVAVVLFRLADQKLFQLSFLPAGTGATLAVVVGCLIRRATAS